MGRSSIKTVDWSRLEIDFISSEITLTELCRRNKVSYPTAWVYKRDHDWDKKRASFRKERNKVSKAAVLEEQKALAVARFRSSEEIRSDAHNTSREMFDRIRELFIDPNTGKRRVRMPRLTSRQFKDYTEVVERTFKLQMLSAGHELTPETINHNSKVMVAGVSIEQIMQLPDDQLDKVLSVASKASDIGVSGGREASVEAEHSEDVSSEPKDGKV